MTHCNWIACSERMPEIRQIEPRLRTSDRVLVFIAPKRAPAGNWTEPAMAVMSVEDLDGKACWYSDGDGDYASFSDVTHWMPLPEPPAVRR